MYMSSMFYYLLCQRSRLLKRSQPSECLSEFVRATLCTTSIVHYLNCALPQLCTTDLCCVSWWTDTKPWPMVWCHDVVVSCDMCEWRQRDNSQWAAGGAATLKCFFSLSIIRPLPKGGGFYLVFTVWLSCSHSCSSDLRNCFPKHCIMFPEASRACPNVHGYHRRGRQHLPAKFKTADRQNLYIFVLAMYPLPDKSCTLSN